MFLRKEKKENLKMKFESDPIHHRQIQQNALTVNVELID